ncbi:MAG TPA: hypothetical protein VFN44_15225, partial [Solirubrobacteraceae bacterium]|nr:hypothetical protein [Solirubrobacteraceae bacterium]
MEIVIVTGVVALAGLLLFTLRMRAARGSARQARSSRQWSGSAGSRRARAAQPAAAVLASLASAVAPHLPSRGVLVSLLPELEAEMHV